MDSQNRIVIGLDFGTTYSGIAWSISNGAKDIEVLSTWPGGGNKTTPKAPTAVLYRNGTVVCGYETGDPDDVIRGVKLLLNESQNLPYKPARRSSFIIQCKGKTPAEVAADYISHMVALADETLERRFGGALEFMHEEYVLTVPAVWSDKAKAATLATAVEAGIDLEHVSLVSEPEAAALYCIDSIQPNTIDDGDVILVCDAGGGTVDLISYCVESVSPLRLTEATGGTGDLCGSTLLDESFRQYLPKVFGNEYDKIPPKTLAYAMKYWEESVKPNFGSMDADSDTEDGYGDVETFVPFPGVEDDAAPGMENGFLAIPSDDIRGIFDPIIRRVEELIQSQIQSVTESGMSTKAILLVGGFGASEYLFQRVKQKYKDIVIMQPSNAWSAVSRGAVLRGLEGNQVQHRIARRHHGHVVTQTVYSQPNPKDGHYWCDLEEVWKQRDLMKWYIHKGETVYEEKPVKMCFYKPFEVQKVTKNPDILCDFIRLYVYNGGEAPDMLKKGVSFLCRLNYDLRSIPRGLFKKRRNSKGVEYYVVGFDILMKPTSASILFELLHDGRTYGSVNAEY